MNITKDSRKCNSESIYFCFKGESVDGHDYINDAIRNGCTKIIGTSEIENEYYTKVNDIDIEFSNYAMDLNDFSSNKMKFIAVTGTDGKTSTALLIHQLLNKVSSCAYLGTSGFIVKDKLVSNEQMTTPFADVLFKNISYANESCEYFVMEVSSHALAQKRIHGLKFDVAIFTNFTQDHLDFHKTLDNYFAEKSKIINYLKPNAPLLYNSEFEILKNINYSNKLTFGLNGDYKFSDVTLNLDCTKFKLNNKYLIRSSLLAEFNVYNLVSALATLDLLKYNITDFIDLCDNLYVDGRLMYVKSKNSADVILDFAHTSDAIKKVLDFVNSQAKDKQQICVLCGSAGGREHLKRPAMGKACSDNSDYLILTTDDPRFESVDEINNQIASGVVSKCEVIKIKDRIDAIKKCFEITNKDDIIIMLGKSGQDVMYIEDRILKYNETKIVTDMIKELNEGY